MSPSSADWDARTFAALQPEEPKPPTKPLRWIPPTIDGPHTVRVAPGLRYGLPLGARTFPMRLHDRGVYVWTLAGTLHMIATRDGTTAEEAVIPPRAQTAVRKNLGLPLS